MILVPGQPAADADGDEGDQVGDTIESPAKVMRIGSMVRQLLDEVRHAPLDDASRARMREVYETSVKELSGVLSSELRDELERLSLPFEEGAVPSDAELRIAHAQLVGWLEGLFHGIQAMLFAQQMETRQRLDEMRRPGLPPARGPGDRQPDPGEGTYL
ncbi:MAG: bacterial proteasome activator family protein [Actinomycetota bacterium]|nr:bacterial proteasome activator family protein [Actinomycetota bacterium]